MTGKKFRVNTDQLADVAKQAQDLLDTINGKFGNTQGDYDDFAGATEQGLAQGIAPLWNNSQGDPFSKGYSFEHKGMMATYDNMKQQLQLLVQACSTTVTTYQDQEDNTKKGVNATTDGWVK